MKRLLLILFLMVSEVSAQNQAAVFTAAWWNVENLFDLRDDPKTNDDEFTPTGDRHWTRRRLNDKVNGIYKTLLMMDLPDVVGLGEVENAYVLRELCQGTPLAQIPYRYVHYDSPDRRGIDVALIYRTDRFTVTHSRSISVSDSAEGYFTRDILLVEGVTAEMVELHAKHPTAAIIAMGDMNSSVEEAAIAQGMGFGSDTLSSDGIRLLTQRLPRDMGSHKYQGQWRYIDQMFLLADESWQVKKLKLLRFDHLLTDDGNRPGQRPKRTYQGPRYEGGLSDHLPMLLRLQKK